MMYNFRIRNNSGSVLDFDSTNAYTLYQVDGLCPPVATLNFTDVAGYDGALYNSSQLPKRNIVLYIKLHPDVEYNRVNLYRFLQPKSLIRCYYQNRNRNVYTDGYVETCDVTPFSNNEVVQSSIICPSPYWLEVSETEIPFTNVISLFEFPFSIEKAGVPFGEYGYNAYFDAGSGGGFTIKINIYGDGVVSPCITNATTGDFFRISNDFHLQSGDIITISTTIGQKAVTLTRNGEITNALTSLSSGSNLFTLQRGYNLLILTATSGEDLMTSSISFRRQWIGV